MTYVAGGVALVALLIALVHFLWGLRIFWPHRDETVLARTVVGGRGIVAMPSPLQCHLVALALILTAGIAIGLGLPPLQTVAPPLVDAGGRLRLRRRLRSARCRWLHHGLGTAHTRGAVSQLRSALLRAAVSPAGRWFRRVELAIRGDSRMTPPRRDTGHVQKQLEFGPTAIISRATGLTTAARA